MNTVATRLKLGIAGGDVQATALPPAQVQPKLRQSDDLGKPGNDIFYEHGFVKALRAVQ